MPEQDLAAEIIELRIQNKYAALKLQYTYDEIDAFVATYYKEVGDLCIKISEIEEKQKAYKKKIKGTQDTSEAIISADVMGHNIGFNEIRLRQTAENSMDKEAKILHRKLLKMIHPDVSEEKLKSAEYTRMVNEAYNQKNYAELVKLDQMINSGKATKQDLIKQRNKLIDATFDLKIQYEQVTENPIFKLMQKFKSQEDNGVSMIKQIRKNLDLRYTTERRNLVNLRLEYLEKMQDKITA